MKHFIRTALALTESELNQLEEITVLDNNDLIVQLKVKQQYCPECNTETTRIKGYTNKKISHSILVNRDTMIFYRCRRYLCIDCNRSFIEANPFTHKEATNISSFTIINILEALRPYTATFSGVAKRFNVSNTKVVEIFDRHVQISRKELSYCLCLDEFYFNRHSKYKYAFMIMDFEKKIIIDVVESRHQTILSSYFYAIPYAEREKVGYVCIDMYRPYKELANAYLKNAKVCVDPFHLSKGLNDALNSVRKRIMRNFAKQDNHISYKLLKYRYKLLLKKSDDIDKEHVKYDRSVRFSATEDRILELILNIHDDIRLAYTLKERFVLFNDCTEDSYNESNQRDTLLYLIEVMKSSGLKEMIYYAGTLENWFEEILNSFKWIKGRRISNGPIEGKNNYIKKILSNANGMSNFARARNRIIYSQNQFERYSLIPLKSEVKRKGKKRGNYKKRNQVRLA